MDYRALFTSSENDLGIDHVISCLRVLENATRTQIADGAPSIGGEQNLDYGKALDQAVLADEPMDAEEALRDVAGLTTGLPLWNHPGTMLNVIPPVNLVSAAAGTFVDILNANLSQGHYSGNLALAELKVVKYLSQLADWNWTETGGIFTFGGKGTSMYALKCAINRAYPAGKHNGYDKKFFFISSAKGHPCHAEVAEWLGIGKNSCIRISTSDDGKISVEEAEKTITSNIEQGRVFLGCILSGGSTVEFEVDDIRAVRTLTQRIKERYDLPYLPWIHVDSVVGWPWLFYSDYDFEKNELRLSDKAQERVQGLSKDISGIIDADSFGADFHKTGFCPYVSSLFMCRSREELGNVSNTHPDQIPSGDLGIDYSPFTFSLELSRSAKGAVSAMVALNTMGKSGYRKLIADMVENVIDLRKQLRQIPFVELLNPDARGFATLFVIKPPEFADCSLQELLTLPKKDTERIKKYNVRFGNFVAESVKKNETTVNFTATDAFAVNNTDVYLGMVKIYPMSVLGSTATNKDFVAELCRLKVCFDTLGEGCISDCSALDMVYRKKDDEKE